jgi:DNA-binding response OmpR family regulator
MTKKITILIVEDEPKISKVYRDHFASAGYAVALASDGQAGLRLAKSTLPDIILLVIIMPVMDGSTMLKALKADRALKNIPVVMLTTLEDAERVDAALTSGSPDYLVKSNYTLEMLQARIHAVLSIH